MRRSQKSPSQWLRLLCSDWSKANGDVVEGSDSRFIEYKPYTQGLLSPQLLCRLSIPTKDTGTSSGLDFWGILGVSDEFDKSYIVAQIERFNTLYNIRNPQLDDNDSPFLGSDFANADPTVIAAAAANLGGSPGFVLPAFLNEGVAAATHAQSSLSRVAGPGSIDDILHLDKKEQRRISRERKEEKAKERQAAIIRKATERAQREAEREAKKRKREEIKIEREKFAKEQKDAAIKRAEDLVNSNRVPIEITRGALVARTPDSANNSFNDDIEQDDPYLRRKKSAIIVSTAADLHAVVTHARNLWNKYNSIAREHGQKVSWLTVSNELGINRKVREKYFRMHARAEQRGFDWEKNKDLRVKDHPEIFMVPTQVEQTAKMPPPPPALAKTVLIESTTGTDEFIEGEGAPPIVDGALGHPSSNIGASDTGMAFVADPTAGLDSADV